MVYSHYGLSMHAGRGNTNKGYYNVLYVAIWIAQSARYSCIQLCELERRGEN